MSTRNSALTDVQRGAEHRLGDEPADYDPLIALSKCPLVLRGRC